VHWTLLDLAIYAAAVGLFLVFCLLVYRHVRRLLRAVKAASARVADASGGLSAEQAKAASRH
jgi:hypothetical protein